MEQVRQRIHTDPPWLVWGRPPGSAPTKQRSPRSILAGGFAVSGEPQDGVFLASTSLVGHSGAWRRPDAKEGKGEASGGAYFRGGGPAG